MRHSYLLIAFLVALVPGCAYFSNVGTDTKVKAQADAVVAMAIAANTVVDEAPSPDDTPKPGVCENCHGTGKSGDGLAKCQVCNGTGRITAPSPEPLIPMQEEAVEEPLDDLSATDDADLEEYVVPVKIEIHASMEDSAFARRWCATDMLELQNRGIEVVKVKEDSGIVFFMVCGPKTCVQVDGRPSVTQLLQILEKVK